MNELEQAYLEHHGILGQKWGRKQGPPYPLGAEDHSAKEKKEGYKKSLGGGHNEELYDRDEEKKPKLSERMKEHYKNDYKRRYKDMTDEEATEAAEKKYKTVRNVAIGSAVAIGTASAIMAYRQLGRNYVDGVIKSGTTIQTLKNNPDHIDNGRAFFTSFREGDNKKYVGLFAKNSDGSLKKKINMDVEKDIKIAGTHTAKKVYKNLQKTNSEFQKANGYGKNYEKFNTYGLLANANNKDKKAADIFYDELKKLGYGAVADINDRKNSGFNTKAAIIFDKANLDHVGNVVNKKISNINAKDINRGYNYWVMSGFRDIAIKPTNVALGSVVVGSTIVNYQDDKVNKEQIKKKKG